MAIFTRRLTPEGSPSITATFVANGGAQIVVKAYGARYSRNVKRNGHVTHREAAALMQVSRETIWRWTKSGVLTPFTMQDVQVVSLSELHQLATQRGAGEPPRKS